jgi:hypothetical protein
LTTVKIKPMIDRAVPTPSLLTADDLIPRIAIGNPAIGRSQAIRDIAPKTVPVPFF